MSKLIRTFHQAAMLAACLLVSSSCTDNKTAEGIEGKAYENKVIDYMPSDPHQLNPCNRTDAASVVVLRSLFQSLVCTDYFNYELTPQLAKAVAIPVERADGKTELSFEIKEGAQWDNGTPITGEDVAFSLKMLKLPKTDNAHLKLYFEAIEDINIDKANPSKFTLLYKEPYMLMQPALEDLAIIPAYVYDEEGILKNYTLKQIATGGSKLNKDPKLIKAAENFNSSKFQNKIVSGSGPYKFEKWLPTQRVVLKRKKDWWGDKYKGESHWFDADPDQIIYEIIGDGTTAVTALRGEKVDAMNRIEPRAFIEDLQKSESFMSKFNVYTPTQFIYTYIGMNMRNPKFEDVRVRRAMRHLADVETYNKQVVYGMAERVTSFIHPTKKKFINTDLKPIKFNIEKARALMAEAGWKDTNGNGTLDKEIDGELVEFEVDFLYPNVAKTSEKGVLMFQEAARKIGLEINATPMEFSVMVNKTKGHDFDLYYGIWGSSPLEVDPKQTWHSDSHNGGSNYVGFGTPESDKLIEDLRKELDIDKRAAICKELQILIDRDAPYVFMSAIQNRVAVHKKFGKVKNTGIKPGYYTPSMQVMNVVQQ